jgi:hypothetical protein
MLNLEEAIKEFKLIVEFKLTKASKDRVGLVDTK